MQLQVGDIAIIISYLLKLLANEVQFKQNGWSEYQRSKMMVHTYRLHVAWVQVTTAWAEIFSAFSSFM